MTCRMTRTDAEVRSGDRVKTVRSAHRFKEPGRFGAPLEACYYCGLTREQVKAEERRQTKEWGPLVIFEAPPGTNFAGTRVRRNSPRGLELKAMGFTERKLVVPPEQFVVLHCPHCGKKHVDKNVPEFDYADVPHPRHWCLPEDDGCGRFFFTKPLIGVADVKRTDGPAAGVGAVAPR